MAKGKQNKSNSFGLDASGATAVEFALVAPVLIFLLLGIVAFGYYLGVAHGVQEAASHGARAAVAGLDPAERTRLARDAVASFVGGSLLLDPARLAVEAASTADDPDMFRVTLTYDLKATLISIAPKGVNAPQSVVRSTVIRRGGL